MYKYDFNIQSILHKNKGYVYITIGVPLYTLMYFNYNRKEFPQRKHTYVCSQSRRNTG